MLYEPITAGPGYCFALCDSSIFCRPKSIMSSSSTGEETLPVNFFSTTRSRRLACDRCHRHKLRCERSPIIINGNMAVPLGSCKRCTKAQVPCQTVNSSFITGNGDGAVVTATIEAIKRKTPPTDAARVPKDGRSDDCDSTMDTTGTTAVSQFPTTEGIQNDDGGQNSSSTEPFFDGAPFSPSDSSLLDLDSFDFGPGDVSSSGDGTVSTPTPLSSPGLAGNLNAPLTRGENNETMKFNVDLMQFEPFMGSSYFSATPAPMGFQDTDIMMDGDDSSFAFVDPTVDSQASSHEIDAQTPLQSPFQHESPSGSRGECRKGLLELHSLLFNDLQCITDTDLREALFSVDSGSLSQCDTRSAPGPEDHIVRRVLYASECLIELMSLVHAVCGGSGQSHPCVSEPPRRQQFYHQHPNNKILESISSWAHSGVKTALKQSVSPSPNPPSSNLQDPKGATTTISNGTSNKCSSRVLNLFKHPSIGRPGTKDLKTGSSPTSSSVIDLPIVISFLTCYVGLLSVYRAIFTNIHDALLAIHESASVAGLDTDTGTPTPIAPDSRPSAPSSQVRGALDIYGEDSVVSSIRGRRQQHRQAAPMLKTQQTLSIRIQMEVMAHMLEQVDDAWGRVVAVANTDGQDSHHRYQQHHRASSQKVAPGSGGGGREATLFGSASTMRLLRGMLAHEGYAESSSTDDGLAATNDDYFGFLHHGIENHKDVDINAMQRYRLGIGSLVVIQRSIRRLLRNTGSGSSSFA